MSSDGGNDVLVGGEGGDLFVGDNQSVAGTRGNDLIYSGGGADFVMAITDRPDRAP